uniref:Cysteine-rich protein 1 n=1 Tax=Datisca glomerata TaxID=34297 RepID=H6SWQ1_DATGL|nr:cysteine-rich protein 1 [Datisca glomerata]
MEGSGKKGSFTMKTTAILAFLLVNCGVRAEDVDMSPSYPPSKLPSPVTSSSDQDFIELVAGMVLLPKVLKLSKPAIKNVGCFGQCMTLQCKRKSELSMESCPGFCAKQCAMKRKP